MKNKLVYTFAILLLFLVGSVSAWKITGATEAQKKYILESIRIRVALESGNFQISNKLQQYDVSGSMWIRSLIVCSNSYRFIDKITYQPYYRRHSVSLFTDLSAVGARYSFSLWRGWGPTIQADTDKRLFLGVEKRF